MVGKKPLNLKKNGKKKTGVLDKMTKEKTSQFKDEQKRKTGGGDE